MGRKGWFQTRYQSQGGGGVVTKPSNFAVLGKYKLQYSGGGDTSILPSNYALSYEKVNNLSVLPSNYTLEALEPIVPADLDFSILPSNYKQFIKSDVEYDKSILPSNYKKEDL